MRWLRDLYCYGGTGSFWFWLSLTVVGSAIVGSLWLLRLEVGRLVDVLERTNCSCEVESRPGDLIP